MPTHNTANPLAATPTKLRNGSWGATTSASAAKGDVVRIRTKAGKEWDALIVSVVWTGDGKSIVATESLDRPRRDTNHDGSEHGRSGGRGRWTGCSCGSIEDQPRDSDCASCQHDY